MASMLYVHWNRQEALARAAAFQEAGHVVQCHHATEQRLKLAEALPDVVVISLDRLPSHGRAVAEWFVEAKKRRHIPLLFTGGAPDKVAATKSRFPEAHFAPTEQALGAIELALAASAASRSKAPRARKAQPATGKRTQRSKGR